MPHAQTQEVLQRRQTDDLTEAGGEGGAGEVDSCRQLGNRPRVTGIGVDRPQCGGERGVVQRASHPTGRLFPST